MPLDTAPESLSFDRALKRAKSRPNPSLRDVDYRLVLIKEAISRGDIKELIEDVAALVVLVEREGVPAHV